MFASFSVKNFTKNINGATLTFFSHLYIHTDKYCENILLALRSTYLIQENQTFQDLLSNFFEQNFPYFKTKVKIDQLCKHLRNFSG